MLRLDGRRRVEHPPEQPDCIELVQAGGDVLRLVMGFGTGVGGRRLLGLSALVAALAMLVAGQTVLQGRLAGVFFLIYWAACFIFTLLAMVMALRDAQAVRHQTQNEERALLHDTIREIISEAETKSSPPTDGRVRRDKDS